MSKTYKIAVIPGDGTGPEVIGEGCKVLDAAAKRCHAAYPDFPAKFSAHELRHTAASLMISSGAHVKTIQRQLGHKSAAMTLDQYGHLFDDDLDVIAGAMGSTLFPGDCGQNVGTSTESGEETG